MSVALSGRAYAFTVVLDPGHGGIGTAGSGAIYEPYIEKDINLKVALLLKDELEEQGIEVFMTRSEDLPLSLEERAEIAASYNPDMFISLHFNSSGPHDKAGSEIWVSQYEPFHSKGTAAGSAILSHLNDLGFSYKGVKVRQGSEGDYYGIIRHGVKHNIPTIIVEHCFIDNILDRLLLENAGITALAHADALGIIDYASETGQLISAVHSVSDDVTGYDIISYDISGSGSKKTNLPATRQGVKQGTAATYSAAHKVEDATRVNYSKAHDIK